MAHRKASLGDKLAELSMDFAVNVARSLIATQFPSTAKYLNGISEAKPKTKRKQKAPDEVRISKGVFYTPPPNRR